jgi:RNase P/RNase MRP subunit p29
MVEIKDFVLGGKVKVLNSKVPRVVGRTGRIVRVSRSLEGSPEGVKEEITVDIPGHGSFVLPPSDLEIVA